jgi:hypothetical protein
MFAILIGIQVSVNLCKISGPQGSDYEENFSGL